MTSGESSLHWPDDPADVVDPEDWVSYKFRSAQWYIDALRQLDIDNGVNRLFGIELALDGAFSQLNGAFDAAVAGLIKAAEAAFPSSLTPSEDHWRTTRRLLDTTFPELISAGFASPEPALPADLTIALRSKPQPPGWLEEFRRARNKTMHQTTISRHFDALISDGPEQGTIVTQAASKIDVGQPVDTVPYLESTRDQIRLLIDRLRRIQKALP